VQLSREFIDSGKIGKILTGNFIFAFPGMQTCHPDPESWFMQGGGPVIDMGPYFFTTLVNLLGPAKNIRSRGLKFSNNRTYEIGPKKGQQFNVEVSTSYMFDIEFDNNAVVQGFLSFDVNNHGRNHMELYGTTGSIIVPDPNMFGGPVLVSKELGSEWIHHSVENKLLGKTNIFTQSSRSNEAPKQSNYRGVGLAEMLNAIENQKLHRCNGKLALHVLDMIDLTMNSAQSGDKKNLRTTCERPEIFLDDEIKKLMK
jgi:predicted dehydrogenase